MESINQSACMSDGMGGQAIDIEGDVTSVQLPKLKRTLHFSDGTLEQLSESDSEIDGGIVWCFDPLLNREKRSALYNFKCQAQHIGIRIAHAVDYVGEGLARFLGITTPKFMTTSDIQDAHNELINDTINNWNTNNNNYTTNYPRNVVSVYP